MLYFSRTAVWVMMVSTTMFFEAYLRSDDLYSLPRTVEARRSGDHLARILTLACFLPSSFKLSSDDIDVQDVSTISHECKSRKSVVSLHYPTTKSLSVPCHATFLPIRSSTAFLISSPAGMLTRLPLRLLASTSCLISFTASSTSPAGSSGRPSNGCWCTFGTSCPCLEVLFRSLNFLSSHAFPGDEKKAVEAVAPKIA